MKQICHKPWRNCLGHRVPLDLEAGQEQLGGAISRP